MKGKSIRYYFFTSMTVVLLVGLLVMGLIQAWLAMNVFREEKENLLGSITRTVAQAALDGSLALDGSTMRTLWYLTDVTTTVAFVASPEGEVVASAGLQAPYPGDTVPQAVLQAVRHAQTAPAAAGSGVGPGAYSELGTLEGLFEGRHYTCGRLLQNQSGQTIGYVFASADASARNVYLADTLSTFILSAALVLVFSSLVALGFTNRTVIPIRRIGEAARRFGEGDYSARVPVEGDDELMQLAVTFNEMANSLQSTDGSRRSFMGNISHELRTPMTTIKGFIDGILDGTIPPEKQQHYLQIVSDEVGRLARLTQNMLDISRLEAGEYTPQNVTFDVWQSVTTVVLGAQQRLENQEVAIEGLEDTSPAWVFADKDFVHQVLFNLLDNAIKFTGQGGTIGFSVSQAKGYATVCISNTGTGIDGDALSQVFDRFYKADQSRGVNARGAGLGLHICRVLVSLMGGRIWAESDSETEARFCFTLPLGSAPKRARGRTRQMPAVQVEDEE